MIDMIGNWLMIINIILQQYHQRWYANESEKIDNITDGYVATYVTKNTDNHNKYYILLDNITDGDNDNITDMSIEFAKEAQSRLE